MKILSFLYFRNASLKYFAGFKLLSGMFNLSNSSYRLTSRVNCVFRVGAGFASGRGAGINADLGRACGGFLVLVEVATGVAGLVSILVILFASALSTVAELLTRVSDSVLGLAPVQDYHILSAASINLS
jgi:hypothetical protein